MKIQPLRHSDIGQLKELQPPDWNDIAPHFKYYIDSPYSNPVKIVSENKITGIGTTIKNKDSAWLAHIIVHPEYRNKGLGKKITDALVKSIDRRKYKTIYLIATKLGYPVYLKSRFELEGEYAHFNIEPVNINLIYLPI
ncbi:MAG: GNAT family N-acetyltransferase [Ignavibacteria bacterium]